MSIRKAARLIGGKEYVGYAEYCVKLARQVNDPESRSILREMAAEWLRLVDKGRPLTAALPIGRECYVQRILVHSRVSETRRIHVLTNLRSTRSVHVVRLPTTGCFAPKGEIPG
jgi:hypothetical protein